MLLATMDEIFPGREGEIIASHFLVFITKLLEVTNEWTEIICCLQSVRFVERVRISSAWDRAPTNSPFMLSPHDLDLTPKELGQSQRERALAIIQSPDEHRDGG